jgi:drug/metabolite transporter (DMT)-like permease
MHQMKTRDMFELLVLAAVWGGSFLFLRMAAPVIGPLGLAAFRVTGAALMLLPLVALRGELNAVRRLWRPLIGAALLSSILPFLGLSQASRSLPAGLMSILNATTPMWGALVGWLWAGERLAAMRIMGLATGFAGVALLAADGSQVQSTHAYGAVALSLGSTLMYAFAVHYNKKFLSGMSPLGVSAGTLVVAALLLGGPAFWIGPQPSTTIAHAPSTWAEVPMNVWGALTALTVLCTGLAYVVFYRLIDRIGASRALTVTFLIPAFGMLWGTLFLHERVTPLMLMSTGVILLGTWLSNQSPSRPQAPDKPAGPGLQPARST